ncbi:hypothetical protein [Sphingobacterium bambusae]|uniref:DUF4345 domain-containing protein n=1 Tax=Sphingobacterium bambusae TaxID=662858 RepID=A0ABW6BNF1_9SPHI|nr:hypothetical protein [Sphingobacterium bambusae]WPL50936.1 hypothetical protein SCB77_10795 [Sphingobacterium bambusae]
MNKYRNVNWQRVLIIILLTVNATGALLAGYGFMRYPDGSSLGMDTTMLRFSPFDNFLIPGIILFCGNGLLSLATVLLLVCKKPLANPALLLQGIVLVGWIAVQMIMLRETNYLQLTFGFVGLLFLRFGYSWTYKRG